jgi:hypothetical protein
MTSFPLDWIVRTLPVCNFFLCIVAMCRYCATHGFEDVRSAVMKAIGEE